MCALTLSSRFLILLALALVAGCSKPQEQLGTDPGKPSPAAPANPVLAIDPPSREITNIPPAYQFAPARSLWLDTSRLGPTNGHPINPLNMVQLFIGEDAYMLSEPTVTNVYVLDSKHIRPIRGGPFPGFRTGDQGMLAVGRTMPERYGAGSISIYWVGTFRVK